MVPIKFSLRRKLLKRKRCFEMGGGQSGGSSGGSQPSSMANYYQMAQAFSGMQSPTGSANPFGAGIPPYPPYQPQQFDLVPQNQQDDPFLAMIMASQQGG